MNEILVIKNFYKSYKSKAEKLNVFSGANLNLKRSTMAALSAPSGTGKSTLLHAIGLLDSIDSGEIIFDGVRVDNISSRKKTLIRRNNIGFVYQFHHLLPDLTVLENVNLPQIVAGISSKNSNKYSIELLEKIGLSEKLKMKPNELSGGEQQRVAICRALSNKPSLLLADEPTGNLDPENSENVFNLLQDIINETGLSAIIATHNPELAKKMNKMITIKEKLIIEN